MREFSSYRKKIFCPGFYFCVMLSDIMMLYHKGIFKINLSNLSNFNLSPF